MIVAQGDDSWGDYGYPDHNVQNGIWGRGSVLTGGLGTLSSSDWIMLAIAAAGAWYFFIKKH